MVAHLQPLVQHQGTAPGGLGAAEASYQLVQLPIVQRRRRPGRAGRQLHRRRRVQQPVQPWRQPGRLRLGHRPLGYGSADIWRRPVAVMSPSNAADLNVYRHMLHMLVSHSDTQDAGPRDARPRQVYNNRGNTSQPALGRHTCRKPAARAKRVCTSRAACDFGEEGSLLPDSTDCDALAIV